jgi:hypothetical protein
MVIIRLRYELIGSEPADHGTVNGYSLRNPANMVIIRLRHELIGSEPTNSLDCWWILPQQPNMVIIRLRYELIKISKYFQKNLKNCLPPPYLPPPKNVFKNGDIFLNTSFSYSKC